MLDVRLHVVDLELKCVNSQIDALYWCYTRTKRGKPPCIVRPDIYAIRRQLENVRRALSRPAGATRRK